MSSYVFILIVASWKKDRPVTRLRNEPHNTLSFGLPHMWLPNNVGIFSAPGLDTVRELYLRHGM